MAYRDDEVSILRAENTSLRNQLSDKGRVIDMLMADKGKLIKELTTTRHKYYSANSEVIRLNDLMAKPAWKYEGKYPPSPSPFPMIVIALMIGMVVLGFMFGVGSARAVQEHRERQQQHVGD